MSGADPDPESCVRLFLSADLVGSTAYKNRGGPTKTETKRDGMGPPWANLFHNFYAGFSRIFDQKLGTGNQVLEQPLRPQLVKTIGDELLLQAIISSPSDAAHVIRFFSKALVHYADQNLKDEGLLLKGAAWIAGFPINNYLVRFEETNRKDYIGPSMDAGFRIAKFATPNKLIVSVDLALLLLSADPPISLHFDSAESLSGVLAGKPYPIIWYKVEGSGSDLLAAELELRGLTQPPTKLCRYCEEYIKSCDGTWLIRPYFLDGSDTAFREMPKRHELVRKTSQMTDDRNYEPGDDGPLESQPGYSEPQS